MAPPPAAARKRWAPGALSRLAVTVTAISLVVIAANIHSLVLLAPPGAGEVWEGISVLSHGIQPMIYGFVIVEVLALLVPAWNRRRVGNAERRAPLRLAAVLVGTAILVAEASSLMVSLSEGRFVAEPGKIISRPLVAALLLLPTFALLGLAQWVDRKGLGSGLVAVMLGEGFAGGMATVRQWIELAVAGQAPFGQVAFQLVLACVLIAGTVYLLERPVRAEGEPAALPSPASGFVPLMAALTVFDVVLITTSLVDGGLGGALIRGLQASGWPFFTVYVVTVANLAILFSWLFNRPSRVAASWAAFAAGGERARRAVRIRAAARVRELLPREGGLSLLMGMAAALLFLPSMVPLFSFRVTMGPWLFFGVAAVVDIVDEVRARARAELVPVWQLTRPYEVEPVLKALESAGIPAFARAARARTCYQFFGPFAPIEVLVPPDQRGQARKIFEKAHQD